MAGRSGPSGDPPDNTRIPKWMLREDELGHTIALIALLMKARKVDANENVDGAQTEPSLPTDPFVVANAVLLALGTKDARKVHASKEARGSRYILRTNSRSICEKLKQIRELSDNIPVEVIEHPTLNFVQGVIYDVDTIDKSEEYIQENLKDQGVCGVRRIKKRRDKVLVNTPLLVLTIHGSVLPEFLYFGLLRIKIRQYYSSPMMCYRCANYGHTKKRCDEKKIRSFASTAQAFMTR